jgi:hypothetical protein
VEHRTSASGACQLRAAVHALSLRVHSSRVRVSVPLRAHACPLTARRAALYVYVSGVCVSSLIARYSCSIVRLLSRFLTLHRTSIGVCVVCAQWDGLSSHRCEIRRRGTHTVHATDIREHADTHADRGEETRTNARAEMRSLTHSHPPSLVTTRLQSRPPSSLLLLSSPAFPPFECLSHASVVAQ